MEQLTTRDSRRILHLLHRLYAVQSHAEFIGELVAALPTVISTDVSSYNEVNSKQHVAAYLGWPPDHPDIPEAQEILGRYAHQSPLVTFAEQSKSIKAHKITDFVSQRSFRTTDLFNQFYRPLQLPYNMAVKVTRGVDHIIAVSLLRSRLDFSSRDIMLLDVMSPHIVQAYHNTAAFMRMQNQVAGSHETLATQHLGLISVTREGRIRFASPASERILAAYERGAKREQGCLPPLVRQWLRHEMNQQVSESAIHRPSSPLRIEGPTGTLTIRLHRQDQHPLLLLEEVHSGCSNIKLRQLGLTSREKEVLTWLSQGKTNPEIGLILGISRRTVHKHLESVYFKLGVENRYAAIRLTLTST